MGPTENILIPQFGVILIKKSESFFIKNYSCKKTSTEIRISHWLAPDPSQRHPSTWLSLLSINLSTFLYHNFRYLMVHPRTNFLPYFGPLWSVERSRGELFFYVFSIFACFASYQLFRKCGCLHNDNNNNNNNQMTTTTSATTTTTTTTATTPTTVTTATTATYKTTATTK